MGCHLAGLLAGLALVPPRAPTLAPRRGWQRSAVASSVRPPPLPDDRPGLPPPTEEGGVLAQILPISLLLESQEADRAGDLAVGEDAGAFAWRNERWGQLIEDGGEVGRDWLTFSAAVGTIMSALVVLWIYSPTGYGDDFLAALEAACGGNSHLVTLAFGILFPLVHSGLAGLRPYASRVTGERLWRVLFASCSLPLAYSWIVYFISHAHDGVVWWNGEASPVAHAVAWCASFSSFFLLYPSVFNLKEVAAVEKPRLHLWETGVIRITRHPQMVGQLLWSAAHLSMVGSSFTALTMALLVGHHLFAVWHGDRRLEAEHGDAFRAVKERTSVWPFLAILDGRQTLPPDYYKELVRAPYVLIAAGTFAAYKAHPYMQAGAALVRNTGLVPGGVLDGLLGE